MKLIHYLKSPYPFTLNRWKISIATGIFVSLFMVIFQPFGLESYQTDFKTLMLLGYGVVTMLIFIVNLILLPFIFPKLLNEDTWTVLKQIILLCWLLISISAVNYIYSTIFSDFEWMGLKGLFIFIGFTLSIAIIPFAGIIIASHNRLLRKNLAYFQQINKQISGQTSNKKEDKTLLLYSKNKIDVIEISISNLIFIESEDNYLNIWCLENELPCQLILRNTLKNIQKQLQSVESICRVHRAFIVNSNHIVSVDGNLRGYTLKLKFTDQEISVGRSYAKEFRRIMNNEF